MISGAIVVRIHNIENLNEYISCWMRTFKVHKMVLKMVLNITSLLHKVLKTVSQREPFWVPLREPFLTIENLFGGENYMKRVLKRFLKMFSKRFSKGFSKGFSNKVLKTVSQREPFLRTIMSTSLFQCYDVLTFLQGSPWRASLGVF